MLSEDTADCQPLVNTALFLRVIEELVERGVVARPGPYCKCRERSASLPGGSARSDDALIRSELMPRLLGPV
jgi:hypothetical protein